MRLSNVFNKIEPLVKTSSFRKVINMRIFLILLLIMLMSAAVGCIFNMNDDYDKSTAGIGAYSITGKFVDNSGNPIAGLTVKLSGDSNLTAVTDGSGTYGFENVATGSYTVTPGDKGTGSKSIIVSNGNVDVGTNNDGHSGNISGDFTCSGCHK